MKYIGNDWRGPAVRIKVGERSYELGCGQIEAELVIRRPGLLRKLYRSPVLAFGEGYMNGDIEVNGSLQSFLQAVYLTNPEGLAPRVHRFLDWLRHLPRHMSQRRAVANARHHYDLGNDFFERWLDPTLTYSCAYYLRDSDDLATAQRQKLEALCQKARLKPGQTLLDIGCGWGSLLLHAARVYGVHATGVTPADAQADYIETVARREGLSDRVRVLRTGWRNISGTFDRIISVGMFEHVGLKQYAAFFRRWRELLADGGISLLHCIGHMRPCPVDPWITKYIFPGGYLPTLTQIAHFAGQEGLSIVDVENLKQHYARTLAQWLRNFDRASDQIAAVRGERFVRMWRLYLNGSQAGFRWGDLQLWQVVLAKDIDHPWPLDRQISVADNRATLSDGRAA